MRLLFPIFIALVSFTIVYGKGGLHFSDPETRVNDYDRLTQRNSGKDVQAEYFRQGFGFNLYIAITGKLLKRFGSKAVALKRIGSIFKHLQTMMKDQSLGAPITMYLVQKGYWNGISANPKLGDMDTFIKKVTSYELGNLMDHYALLTYDHNNLQGISQKGSACQGEVSSKSIVYISDDQKVNGIDAINAKYIAHEIGKTLGFSLDADPGLGVSTDNRKCGLDYIMDKNSLSATQWSNCTRTQFLELYRKNRICLTPQVFGCYSKGSDDKRTTDVVNMCECKAGYFGGKCDNCWPGVTNIGTPGKPICACYMKKTDLPGGDLRSSTNVKTLKDCQALCNSEANCDYFSYDKRADECKLKGVKAYEKQTRGVTYGPRFCSTNLAPSQCFKKDTDLTMKELTKMAVGKNAYQTAVQACQTTCVANPKCEYWTFTTRGQICSLKSIRAFAKERAGWKSGPKKCPKT